MTELLAAGFYLLLWLAPFAVAGTVEWVQERREKNHHKKRPALHVVDGGAGTDGEKEAA